MNDITYFNDPDFLTQICQMYPEWLVEHQKKDIERIEYLLKLGLSGHSDQKYQKLSVCDLGGGNTLLAPGFAAMGLKRSVLIDDFGDVDNSWILNSDNSAHNQLGVEIYSRDLIADGFKNVDGQFDIVTSINSMEHWHNSPKKLFEDVYSKLNPGGTFLLGTPNCVNLRKRLTGLFGKAKWSGMGDWYEESTFRGHVREPDVEDLRYIAENMGLKDIKIIGRNWSGHYSISPLTQRITKIVDLPLRAFPSLCADIYVTGRKIET